MTSGVTLDDWVWVESMLRRAMLGALSSNVKAVVLEDNGSTWLVRVFVDFDTPDEREEIDDIIEEFGSLLGEISDHVTEFADRPITGKIVSGADSDNIRTTLSSRPMFIRKNR